MTNDPPPNRSAALVLNPRAGRLSRLEDPCGQIVAAMAEAGLRLVADPAPELAFDAQLERALAAHPEVLVVAGGDGTIAACIPALIGGDILLAPLPGGTMNRVTERLGLPDDPIAAVAALGRARAGRLDVGEMNGRFFLYQSIIGTPARLGRFREMQRQDGAWWPLLVAALRALLRPPGRSLAAGFGTPRQRIRARTIVVTVPPGRGANLLTEAVLRETPLRRLRQMRDWIRGRLRDNADVLAVESDSVVVTGPTAALRLTLDGEVTIAPPPLRFRLRRGAVRVLRP